MQKKTAQRGKTRFTMWIEKDMLAQLEKIRLTTGKGSIADVIRDSVAVYSSLVTANERGVRLVFEDQKSKEKGHIWLLPGPAPFEA